MDDNSLEAEFRKSLLIIKPFIESLTNTKYISQYQVWLEKLSDTGLSEKRQRNIYLDNLRRQIEAGILKFPFTNPPPYGPLPPYAEFVNSECVYSETDVSDESTTEYLTQCNNPQLGQFNLRSKPKLYSKTVEEKPCTKHFVTYLHPYSKREFYGDPSRQLVGQDYRPTKGPLPMECRKIIIQPQSETPTPPTTATDESQIHHNTAASRSKCDADSWYDITDVSSTTLPEESEVSSDKDFGHGDHRDRVEKNKSAEEIYRSRMHKMSELIRKLQEENKLLHENLEQVKRDLNLRNTRAETSIHNLSSEVDVLRNRLQELIDIKNSLKQGRLRNSNTEKELHTTRLRNIELQTTVISLQKKLQELNTSKSKELSSSKRQLLDLHREELEILKKLHHEQMLRCHNGFKQEMRVHQELQEQKINEIKTSYEAKLSEMMNLYEKLLKEKDQKIKHLEAIVKEQFAKIDQQIKVIQEYFEGKKANGDGSEMPYGLEKQMTKFLLKKYTKENRLLILKLKRELDIQKKSTELQLSAQKAAMVTEHAAMKQQEIDDVVNSLESRYKFMFNKLQQQMILMKSFDAKVISDLRKELFKTKPRQTEVNTTR